MRRNTILRQQILEDDDNLSLMKKSDISEKLSEDSRPPSAKSVSGSNLINDDETEVAEDDEEELFGSFRFRSFKTQKQIDEDYDLLNIEDPEDVTNIVT